MIIVSLFLLFSRAHEKMLHMLKPDNHIEQTSSLDTPVRSLALLCRTYAITWESAVVILLAVLTLFSRLFNLDARVMSHDESLHVYYSWLLSSGKGFVHNPMMHGPFLFASTALMDFLFGASDFTSRLVPVILGTLIAVLMPRLLKPWLGQTGALVTSALLLISHVSVNSFY